jgi:lipoyl(octanoyl) transferase
MVRFTRERGPDTRDEIWVLQHFPVYTQGTSSHDIPESPGRSIPLIHSDRGGQITYHGPGQLVAYLLIDIKRRQTGPKSFVRDVESLVIDFLQQYDVAAHRKTGAPGVYVHDEKIAALGLRISRGCCYHGLSINIDMDLSPYDWINPCGYEDLTVTQLRLHKQDISFDEVNSLFNKRIITI